MGRLAEVAHGHRRPRRAGEADGFVVASVVTLGDCPMEHGDFSNEPVRIRGYKWMGYDIANHQMGNVNMMGYNGIYIYISNSLFNNLDA